ncbi:AAA family ATPase [Cupriavidus sp. WGlv3]|uniref:AAA family ATPase n=1 Tax=Cupriavidus sp. WGlv3 TaxID=2919924 RepID=UPI00209158B1|nr:AAA family ATPase [Cupriavidus sp. WGlv3]MCO4862857.1 AAA family ATPase [Cupriavidus sp. WGlv3]
MAWLTSDQQETLALVLEPRPLRTKKGNPAIRDLSLYSSELKSLIQIATQIEAIESSGKILADIERTRDRYFRTLSIHGLVKGSPAEPKLTPAADIIIEGLKKSRDPLWWRENRHEIETPLFRKQVSNILSIGENAVTTAFKAAFFNAQTFFDTVPANAVSSILDDLDLLKLLQFINSSGYEPERLFRLSNEEQTAFFDTYKFASTSLASAPAPESLIEVSTRDYLKAAQQYQSDVRFRISGFLHAFHEVKLEMGVSFPRIDPSENFYTQLSKSGHSSTAASPLEAKTIKTLKHGHQLIVAGCPGSGKSYYLAQLLDGTQVFRIQFHAETSYFDFVGNYKPTPLYELTNPPLALINGDGTEATHGRPYIDYKFVPGPFSLALKEALTDAEKNVILLIEELNRGNAAAVFGDFFQLLDRSADGSSTYDIEAPADLAAYLVRNGALQPGQQLRLPSNLYLWATMNSADQGVFPLDTAFKRRWEFVYKGYSEACRYPKEASSIQYGKKSYAWDDFRARINRKLIELGIHEDKLIGPYFLTEKQLTDPDAILNKLFLYLWEDVLRFRQTELFQATSFSEVVDIWSAGSGTPLLLDFSGLTAIETDASTSVPLIVPDKAGSENAPGPAV